MITLHPLDIPDLLANLVERSLVVCDPTTGRHHMLESMRVYAAEHLTEEDQNARKRHFEYFLSYAEQIYEPSRMLDEGRAYRLFVPETDNLRLAYEWSIVNDPKRCLHFFTCIGQIWSRSRRTEAEQFFARALAATPEVADEDHVSARSQLARAKLRGGFTKEAGELIAIAARQIDEIPDVDPVLRIGLLLTRGVQEFASDAGEGARAYTLEALALSQEHNLPAFQSAAHINLGELARSEGDLEAFAHHTQEALRFSTGDPFTEAMVRFNLGSVSMQKGDIDLAEKCFRENIALVASVVDISNPSAGLGGLGYVLLVQGYYREAGLLMGYPEARRKRTGARMDPIDAVMFEEYRQLGLSRGGEVFEKAFADGAQLTNEQLADIVDRTKDRAK